MDIDRYIATHQPEWDRLDQLSRQAGKGVRRLDAAELDELVALYQRVSGHLSSARTQFDDGPLNLRLSGLLGTARGVIYRRTESPGRAVARFLSQSIPAAIWHIRRTVIVSAAMFVLPALALGVWLSHDDESLHNVISEEQARDLAEHRFASYYSETASETFQTHVTTNNIQASVLAWGSGVALGIPTVLLLAYNGANVGSAAAIMTRYGHGTEFWGLILPHGLLEITSLVIAGAAGLRLGWAIIRPGDRRRSEALAIEGSRSVVVVAGLAMCFVVAGFIEAWVTPSGLPTVARVGIGVAVEVSFLSYVVGLGRRSAAQGLTGLLGESPRTWDEDAAARKSYDARRAARARRTPALVDATVTGDLSP